MEHSPRACCRTRLFVTGTTLVQHEAVDAPERDDEGEIIRGKPFMARHWGSGAAVAPFLLVAHPFFIVAGMPGNRRGDLQMASPQDVIKMIKENEARFVDFRFTDTRGKEQHVTVPVSAFSEEKFEGGHAFDGSSIAGWKGIQAS
ncbi:MAG: glutamine synthetase beta-grasp domain-containing protein, partial [Candidatus Accumulibacter sp.]|nr:glutamine synthetase beta-grasp domain-containing protein [Accumulibacter sp.]